MQHPNHCQYFGFLNLQIIHTFMHIQITSAINLLQWSMDNLKFIVPRLICVDKQKHYTYCYSQLISLSTQNHRLWLSPEVQELPEDSQRQKLK